MKQCSFMLNTGVASGVDSGRRWPSGRLALLSTRPAVTFLAEERPRCLASTKLYCFYVKVERPGVELATSWSLNHHTTMTYRDETPLQHNPLCDKIPSDAPSTRPHLKAADASPRICRELIAYRAVPERLQVQRGRPIAAMDVARTYDWRSAAFLDCQY